MSRVTPLVCWKQQSVKSREIDVTRDITGELGVGMAKRTRVRDQDKFMLRLPHGLRDRIKAATDRADMSMNEAIVWVLDREFPAPKTVDQRTADLLKLVEVMKAGASADTIADLTDEIHTVLTEISEGKIAVADDVLARHIKSTRRLVDGLR